jgi:hypothetical protein
MHIFAAMAKFHRSADKASFSAEGHLSAAIWVPAAAAT